MADEVPDHKAICAKAGVILEACLDFLTYHYECRLPRKRGGDYQIREMLEAVGKDPRAKLTAEIRANTAKTFVKHPSKPIQDRLNHLASIRNLGAYFKELSFEVLEDNTVVFSTEVRQFAHILCHQDDGWPDKDVDGHIGAMLVTRAA